MFKSICIKTNNNKCVSYIVNELNHLTIDNVYFSCKNYKNYTNIIVHYTGNNLNSFFSSISELLTYLVLDLFEDKIIKKLIELDYFYFSLSEQKKIFNMCLNVFNNEDSFQRFELIQNAFFKYLEENKFLILSGFINFRLYDYIIYLDKIIDICINKYVLDKEYLEFINLLKSYVDFSCSNNCTVHLIYKDQKSILLDDNKKNIEINKNAFKLPFLSDISFSSNDYTLNSLLTIIPSTLFIHLIDEEDEFISTLKLIFEGKFHICNNCPICNLYKKSHVHNTLNN